MFFVTFSYRGCDWKSRHVKKKLLNYTATIKLINSNFKFYTYFTPVNLI